MCLYLGEGKVEWEGGGGWAAGVEMAGAASDQQAATNFIAHWLRQRSTAQVQMQMQMQMQIL